MSFSRPIQWQWYHSHADLIWPDGSFKASAYSTCILGYLLHADNTLANIGTFHSKK
jgi:hypothetical protein